jgi:hypothetical protein
VQMRAESERRLHASNPRAEICGREARRAVPPDISSWDGSALGMGFAPQTSQTRTEVSSDRRDPARMLHPQSASSRVSRSGRERRRAEFANKGMKNITGHNLHGAADCFT